LKPVTTDRIANELLTVALLAVEQLNSGITRLTLEASVNPELSPKVRNLIDWMLCQLREVDAEVF